MNFDNDSFPIKVDVSAHLKDLLVNASSGLISLFRLRGYVEPTRTIVKTSPNANIGPKYLDVFQETNPK